MERERGDAGSGLGAGGGAGAARGTRARGARWSPVLATWLLAAACSAPTVNPRAIGRGAPADALAPAALALLERGLASLAEGRMEDALELLRALALDHPQHVPVGIWLQEARLSQARSTPAAGFEGNPDEPLRRAYRERADAEPSVLALLLAARVEDDPVASLLLLDRALELDPASAWAHYGRAHVLARRGDLDEAGRALDAALAREPAHLPARRLAAWLAARTGRSDEAVGALESWIADCGADLLLVPARRDEARLDLALLLLHAGRTERASQVLGALEGTAAEPFRRLCAQAVALEARGRYVDALAAARAASTASPRAVLPLVQQALILERRLGDARLAREAWGRVLELSEDSEDLGLLLQRWRAQVHLERLERTLDGLPAESPAGVSRS